MGYFLGGIGVGNKGGVADRFAGCGYVMSARGISAAAYSRVREIAAENPMLPE